MKFRLLLDEIPYIKSMKSTKSQDFDETLKFQLLAVTHKYVKNYQLGLYSSLFLTQLLVEKKSLHYCL